MISLPLLNQLRYVKVEDPTIDLHYFPNYLIVGPQRTGTTWLSDNLRLHPQIMVTIPKELFFFNGLDRSNYARFQSNKLDWYLSFFRDDPSSVAWKRKQMFCDIKFGEAYQPIMRGEATASYAILGKRIIREVALLNAQTRIVFTIRDPIERAWSHAKKHFLKDNGRRIEDVTMKEFEEFFNLPFQRKCAQYAQNIDRWLSCFDESQVWIGWFDDLKQRPMQYLLDVLSFLGVKSDKKYINPAVQKVRNATAPIQIPARPRSMLESLLREDIRNLEERFGVRWS